MLEGQGAGRKNFSHCLGKPKDLRGLLLTK